METQPPRFVGREISDGTFLNMSKERIFLPNAIYIVMDYVFAILWLILSIILAKNKGKYSSEIYSVQSQSKNAIQNTPNNNNQIYY